MSCSAVIPSVCFPWAILKPKGDIFAAVHFLFEWSNASRKKNREQKVLLLLFRANVEGTEITAVALNRLNDTE